MIVQFSSVSSDELVPADLGATTLLKLRGWKPKLLASNGPGKVLVRAEPGAHEDT